LSTSDNSIFSLLQNSPNPFEIQTSIRFDLPFDTHVTMEIFNVLGEKVEVLFSKDMNAGEYNIQFNAEKYRAGEYFYRLSTPEFTSVKTMNIVK